MRIQHCSLFVILAVVGLSQNTIAGGSSNSAEDGVAADSTVTGTTGTMNPNGTMNSPGGLGTGGADVNTSNGMGATKTDPARNPNGDIVVAPADSNPTNPASKTSPGNIMNGTTTKTKQDPNHPKAKKPKTNPSDSKSSTHDNLGIEKEDSHESKETEAAEHNQKK